MTRCTSASIEMSRSVTETIVIVVIEPSTDDISTTGE
jgi:hypothetical protein